MKERGIEYGQNKKIKVNDIYSFSIKYYAVSL